MMQFLRSEEPVEYEYAVDFMHSRVRNIIEGSAENLVWLLEHPHLYTVGARDRKEDLPQFSIVPVFHSERGGKDTYHGPGQRVVYCMIDLRKYYNRDVVAYVKDLEQIIINVLAGFNIQAFARYQGNVGVWVRRLDGVFAKIAAIGIRVRSWVTWHGFALNVNPDLSYYNDIVPCGIEGLATTSMWDLGIEADYADVDAMIIKTMKDVWKQETIATY